MTPLAKIAIFGHPPLQILQERSHSIAIFAFFFRYFSPLDQTNFSRFRRTLSTGFDCWLCYFRYFAIGEVRPHYNSGVPYPLVSTVGFAIFAICGFARLPLLASATISG